MKKLIIILALLVALLPSSALAWGPIGHLEIGDSILQERVLTYPIAYQWGSIMPDMFLAGGTGDGEAQDMAHQPAFVDAMKQIATTEEQRVFILGYQSHILADQVEGAYSTSKVTLGAPYSADYAVDGLIGPREPLLASSFSVDLKVLIRDAWRLAYPDNRWSSSTFWFLDIAPMRLQAYISGGLAGIGVGIWPPDAEFWYSDYQPHLDQSVTNILSRLFTVRGDVNSDGTVNMADIIKVERIILRIDSPTPGADANGDGEIDMGDVVKIERIILGIE